MAKRPKRKQAREPTPKMWELSIHLLTADTKGPKSALKPEPEGSQRERRTVALDPNVIDGELTVARAEPHVPAWQELLEQGTTGAFPELELASAGAVLVLKAEGRFFAVTFGQGWHLLDQDKVEEGFGLRAVLNSVDPEKLRSMDLANLDAVSRLRTTQATKSSRVDFFGIDPAQDILREIVGEPRDPDFARLVIGRDTLHLRAPILLRDLPAKCAESLAKAQETRYKKDFPWVDNLRRVRGEKVSELDALLLDEINNAENEQIHLSPPDVVDWTRISRFRYSNDTKLLFHELSMADYLTLHPFGCSEDDLRNDLVIAYDSSDAELDRWRVYKCLVAELEDDKGETYILFQAQWYKAQPSFVEDVNATLKSIAKSKIQFPTCGPDQEEELYNKDTSKRSNGAYALVDRRTISYGGWSKLEPCDLFTNDKTFIHVKRGTRSSTLSHLFLQGTVSAQGFRIDPGFRDKFRDILPASHKALSPKMQPSPSEYTICYAISAKPKRKIPEELPFFSRVSLTQSWRLLDGFGYKVNVGHIHEK